MEPILILKRDNVTDLEQCIICQEDKNEKLLGASQQGLTKIKESMQMRQKQRDTKNRVAIDRIDDVLATNAESLVWHKSCYSSFTSKTHISRLLQRNDATGSNNSSTATPPVTFAHTPSSSLRSSVHPMNWDMCIFCQNVNTQVKLSSVTTIKMSHAILNAAHYDHLTSIRLSGINDLIASEGKYHANCYKQFIRNTSRIKENTAKTDLAMQWLIDELKAAAGQAHVLELSEVWKRYCDLTNETNVAVPPSFISRRSSFKDKLELYAHTFYEFIPMRNKAIEDRQILLVPTQFKHIPISNSTTETDEVLAMPVYQPADDGFLQMVHVALKLRSEIMDSPVYEGLNVSEDDAISCVPDNLFMFLRLLVGGQSLFSDDPEETEEPSITKKESKLQNIILSIGQDLVYSASGGKRWTPKHVGLACTLHQATRSKELVQLFHNAGHIIGYESVLQVDTALAESTLTSMDKVTGAVTPPNLVNDRFVHFTCDNIDINDGSLDGKDSFHATQVACWQRGPASDMGFKSLQTSATTTLQVPEVMEKLFPAEVIEGIAEPTLTKDTVADWYNEQASEKPIVRRAEATDMAFLMTRQDEENTRTGWTHFNRQNSTVEPELTTVGYIPIIQAPAHELDTLHTVVERCRHVAGRLGQRFVVLTVDEALYCKLMELKWAKKQYQNFLIVRLGGLHTSMNFLKVIGKHIQSSGLMEAWIESGILGPRAAEQVLAGKSYARGMRIHKITIQAMWRMIMPQLLCRINRENTQLRKKIEESINGGNVETLISLLEMDTFKDVMDSFVESLDNVNFRFWWSYMQMVHILLLFTRAHRDGNWELHLFAFQSMLPLFMRYDHINYARWGTIYVNEMHQLPVEVLQEFESGNFVVKRTTHKFNQVDPDQSQEWLNETGKKRGGIVGITKTSSALNRWALSYNLRSHISCATREMYNLNMDEAPVHNESTEGRRKHDSQDEDKLMTTLLSFNMFSPSAPSVLQNIATKDLATQQIEDDLLHAKEKGQCQLNTFLEDRLLPCADRKLKLRDRLTKNNALTFSSLFNTETKHSRCGKEQILKADRSILQRLIIAYNAGRTVNLDQILCHELLPVPISLAEMNGDLRTGSKAILSEVLTTDVICPPALPATTLGDDATIIIDAQALVVSIGKPQGCATFGDLSDVFRTAVLQGGSQFARIDIVFDRYYQVSIKAGTRKRRAKCTRPVRRVIENRDVPLPSDWNNFLALAENKADLSRFLSEQMVAHIYPDKTIVVAGGFKHEETVESTDPDVDTAKLKARHEEADTRIIVHCVQNQSDIIVVHARDTDILVLLLAHYHQMPCTKLWLKAGTAKKRKYIPIHTIIDQMSYDSTVLEIIPSFHALTGSDVTSFLLNHSKKTAWRVFKQHHELLQNLGIGPLTEETAKKSELFICRIYTDVPNVDTTDKARALLFIKSRAPESLPPTSDALSFHVKRSHYQAALWRQAHLNYPDLPSPRSMGWKEDDGKLSPIMMSLPPVPQSCLELISCGCTTHCRNLRCKCRKSQLPCTSQCKCKDVTDSCYNDRF